MSFRWFGSAIKKAELIATVQLRLRLSVPVSLSMVFDGELRESCARNLRVALSDRETSLDGNNGQLGSCRDSMRTENEAHSICGSRVVFSTAHHVAARLAAF